MPDSVFDPNSFLETSFPGSLSTEYVNIPDGEGPAQLIELKLAQVDFPTTGGTGVRFDATWELTPGSPFYETAVKETGLDKPRASQQFLLDGDVVDGKFVIDLGTNKNMRLKHVVEATGLNRAKSWNFSQLKFQSAWIKIESSQMMSKDPVTGKYTLPLLTDDGKPRFRAEVSRVTSLDKGTARAR